MSALLEEAFREVRETGNWNRFYRETSADWGRMARYLIARWQLPASVSEEDVAQELLYWACRYLPEWDEERGVELARFVVWNAMTRTKRWIGKRMRGQGTEVPSSAVPRRKGDEEPQAIAQPTQEGMMESAMRVRVALANLEGPERLCLWAFLREGDLASAARAVYDDRGLSLALGLGSEREALERTRRIVRKVAKAMEVMT